MKRFFVYMLATRIDGPLYVGITSNLPKRIAQHRNHDIPGFTARYNIDRLVWFEPHDDVEGAILREKRIKRWRREWKVALIEAKNPGWDDLFHLIEPGMSGTRFRIGLPPSGMTLHDRAGVTAPNPSSHPIRCHPGRRRSRRAGIARRRESARNGRKERHTIPARPSAVRDDGEW